MKTNKQIVEAILDMKGDMQCVRCDCVMDYKIGKVDLNNNYSLIVDAERVSKEYLDGEIKDTRLSLCFCKKGEEDYICPTDIDTTKRSGGSLAWYSDYGRKFPSKKAVTKCITNAMKDFREFIDVQG